MGHLWQATSLWRGVSVECHEAGPIVVDWTTLEDEDEGRCNPQAQRIESVGPKCYLEPTLVPQKDSSIHNQDGKFNAHDRRRPEH